jgi:hypothetical protein
MKKPNYLTVKKVVETEEFYTITKSNLSKEKIEKGLKDGDLNIIQVPTCEPIAWLVDKNGRRVAVLEKDGGCGPSEDVEIKVETLNKV